ncbi:MAG: tetratricopeptide repeat protein, partial [Planctomycetota bacterium]
EVVEEYRDAGLYEESRGLFAYLLENWDETADTMLELQVGVALQSIKLREWDKADAAVAKLIADYNEHPKIGKGLFQIGEQYYYAHNYGQTIKLLELIDGNYPRRVFPSKSELPFILATCYEKLEIYDEAINNYRRSVEQYAKCRFSRMAPYAIGRICMSHKKEYGQALYWFERQRELYPDCMKARSALYFMGTTYLVHLQDYAKAAGAFEGYIAEYPAGTDIWSCYTSLAECCAKMGDFERALGVLREACEKGPSEELQRRYMERIKVLEEGGAQ